MAKCATGKRVGTCDSSDCDHHGMCHCGCGSVMKLSTHTHKPNKQYPFGLTKGMPYMHRAGHTAASLANMRDPRFYRLTWYADAERARELIEMLVTEYGTMTEAANRADVARDTLVRLRHRRLNRVWPQTMQKLERAWDSANRSGLPNVSLPFAPMLAYKPERVIQFGRQSSMGGLKVFDESLQRKWYRAQQSGRVTIEAADELCIHVLHVHPAEIYGDDFYADLEGTA